MKLTQAKQILKDEPTLQLLSEKEIKALYGFVISLPSSESSFALKEIIKILEATLFLKIHERLEKELDIVQRINKEIK